MEQTGQLTKGHGEIISVISCHTDHSNAADAFLSQ